MVYWKTFFSIFRLEADPSCGYATFVEKTSKLLDSIRCQSNVGLLLLEPFWGVKVTANGFGSLNRGRLCFFVPTELVLG